MLVQHPTYAISRTVHVLRNMRKSVLTSLYLKYDKLDVGIAHTALIIVALAVLNVAFVLRDSALNISSPE